MSNYLAIASVTAVLQKIVNSAVSNISQARATAAFPPGTKDKKLPSVNIFLYQVTPNTAWRNSALPARRAEGSVVTRPQTALDLHYLFSFYGEESTLDPQRLLGKVVAVLNSRPFLSRQVIQQVLLPSIHSSASTSYPDPLSDLKAQSDLSEAVESIRLGQQPLSLEDLSRLWAMFPGEPYALSTAYTASVVLIEDDETEEPVLPVKDYRVYSVPFHPPVIHSVEAEIGQHTPILADSKVLIVGQNLFSETTIIHIFGINIPISASDIVAVPNGQDARECLRLNLGMIPGSQLRGGVQSLQIIHQRMLGDPPTLHTIRDSNLAAFVLHPKIENAPLTISSEPDASLNIKINPGLRAGQHAAVLLTRAQDTFPMAMRFDIAPEAADRSSLTVKLSQAYLPFSHYLLRVQVDGAESLLSSSDPSGRYDSPLAIREGLVFEGQILYSRDPAAMHFNLSGDILPDQTLKVLLYKSVTAQNPFRVLQAPGIDSPTHHLTIPALGIPPASYWVQIKIEDGQNIYQGPSLTPNSPKVTVQ